MALSASTNYSINRDTLITAAYKDMGLVRAGGSPTADELTDGAERLNIMIKAWQADGLQSWVIKRATLIPELGAQSYALGTAHCSTTMYKTEIKVAASATDVSIDVDSTTNMSASDYIGIVTDDGTIHWTTISSVTDSDTVVISSGLDSAAAVDNHVYWYTTKIDRPNELMEVYRREYDTVVDVPMNRMSREEYDTLSDKDQQGTPVNFYYDPQLTASKLYVWQTADSTFAMNNVFELRIKKPFDDLDSSTDDFEFPQEWYEAILLGLEARIARKVGYPINDYMTLKADADMAKEMALTFDIENTSIFMRPNNET